MFSGRALRLILICLSGLMLAMPVLAAAAPQSAMAELRDFVTHVSTFQADFNQTETNDSGKVIKQQSGKLWLERATSDTGNGRFRWAYKKPYKQLIVCDGKSIWVYDPDLEQVTTRPAKQALAGTPAALLSQGSTLTDDFDVSNGPQLGGRQIVVLKPKDKQSDFKSVSLAMKDGVPVRMVFRDQLGGATRVVFSHVHKNVKISDKRFEFKPPKGVTVVHAANPGAQSGAGQQ